MGFETAIQFVGGKLPLVVTTVLMLQGTELLPWVTSWKATGNCAFSGYKTKSAWPWRPYFSLISAIMPAKAGDAAEVPPTPVICTVPPLEAGWQSPSA